MSWRLLIVPLALLLVAGLSFDFLQHRLSGPLMVFSAHPEVVHELEESLADQRRLAKLDPENETTYRQRFERLQILVQRLHVLEMNREAIARRYDRIVLVVFALAAALLAGGFVFSQSRRDRRRLRALQNLTAWQEAARRHAHEMKTPLTGARLELSRLGTLLDTASFENVEEIHHAAASARDEIERLDKFAKQFTSFARLPRPEIGVHDLGALLGEFTTTFQDAWTNVELSFNGKEGVRARLDRDMVRQVLVNLADNASLAGATRLTFTLGTEGGRAVVRVRDDGPGIAEDVRAHLFEPYTTTRKIGEGMGLGLAISRKIALDHDGDLELEKTSGEGTFFRLTLPLSS